MDKHTNYHFFDIIYLGIHKISDFYGVYAGFMPFLNEILYLFTLTIFLPYFGLNIYPGQPTNLTQKIQKGFIDMLTITGIVANTAATAAKTTRYTGLVKGSLYAFFAYFIPTCFLHLILKITKNRIAQLFIGLGAFYVLDVIILSLTTAYMHKSDEEKKNHKHEW